MPSDSNNSSKNIDSRVKGRRRSSILKTNPNENGLGSQQDTATTTFSTTKRQSRRVSFAETRVVQEFHNDGFDSKSPRQEPAYKDSSLSSNEAESHMSLTQGRSQLHLEVPGGIQSRNLSLESMQETRLCSSNRDLGMQETVLIAPALSESISDHPEKTEAFVRELMMSSTPRHVPDAAQGAQTGTWKREVPHHTMDVETGDVHTTEHAFNVRKAWQEQSSIHGSFLEQRREVEFEEMDISEEVGSFSKPVGDLQLSNGMSLGMNKTENFLKNLVATSAGSEEMSLTGTEVAPRSIHLEAEDFLALEQEKENLPFQAAVSFAGLKAVTENVASSFQMSNVEPSQGTRNVHKDRLNLKTTTVLECPKIRIEYFDDKKEESLFGKQPVPSQSVADPECSSYETRAESMELGSEVQSSVSVEEARISLHVVHSCLLEEEGSIEGDVMREEEQSISHIQDSAVHQSDLQLTAQPQNTMDLSEVGITDVSTPILQDTTLVQSDLGEALHAATPEHENEEDQSDAKVLSVLGLDSELKDDSTKDVSVPPKSSFVHESVNLEFDRNLRQPMFLKRDLAAKRGPSTLPGRDIKVKLLSLCSESYMRQARTDCRTKLRAVMDKLKTGVSQQLQLLSVSDSKLADGVAGGTVPVDHVNLIRCSKDKAEIEWMQYQKKICGFLIKNIEAELPGLLETKQAIETNSWLVGELRRLRQNSIIVEEDLSRLCEISASDVQNFVRCRKKVHSVQSEVSVLRERATTNAVFAKQKAKLELAKRKLDVSERVLKCTEDRSGELDHLSVMLRGAERKKDPSQGLGFRIVHQDEELMEIDCWEYRMRFGWRGEMMETVEIRRVNRCCGTPERRRNLLDPFCEAVDKLHLFKNVENLIAEYPRKAQSPQLIRLLVSTMLKMKGICSELLEIYSVHSGTAFRNNELAVSFNSARRRIRFSVKFQLNLARYPADVILKEVVNEIGEIQYAELGGLFESISCEKQRLKESCAKLTGVL